MFKKGDRVVVIRDDFFVKEGEILIIDQDDSSIPYCIQSNGTRTVALGRHLVYEHIYNSSLYKIMNEMEE